jgi:hypothetical protein
MPSLASPASLGSCFSQFTLTLGAMSPDNDLAPACKVGTAPGKEELAEGAQTVPSRAFWRNEDFSKLLSQQKLLAGSMGQG